jgi:hypothetical protein
MEHNFQFNKHTLTEVSAIKNVFAELLGQHKRPHAKVDLTIVVVDKRHHTRFLFTYRSHVTNNWNVQPGLFINRAIMSFNPPNLFLQSQHAVQDIARTAHYRIFK